MISDINLGRSSFALRLLPLPRDLRRQSVSCRITLVDMAEELPMEGCAGLILIRSIQCQKYEAVTSLSEPRHQAPLPRVSMCSGFR